MSTSPGTSAHRRPEMIYELHLQGAPLTSTLVHLDPNEPENGQLLALFLEGLQEVREIAEQRKIVSNLGATAGSPDPVEAKSIERELDERASAYVYRRLGKFGPISTCSRFTDFLIWAYADMIRDDRAWVFELIGAGNEWRWIVVRDQGAYRMVPFAAH